MVFKFHRQYDVTYEGRRLPIKDVSPRCVNPVIFINSGAAKNFLAKNYRDETELFSDFDSFEKRVQRDKLLLKYYYAGFCTICPKFIEYCRNLENRPENLIFDDTEVENGSKGEKVEIHLRDIITEAFIFVAMMAKTAEPKLLAKWLKKRLVRLHCKNIFNNPARFDAMSFLQYYWQKDVKMRAIVVSFILSSDFTAPSTKWQFKFARYRIQVKLALEYAQMKTFKLSYEYVCKKPALMQNDVFKEKANLLRELYERLKREHEDFPYIMLLNKSTPEMRVINYSDVAEAAIQYNRNLDKKWMKYVLFPHKTSLNSVKLQKSCDKFN